MPTRRWCGPDRPGEQALVSNLFQIRSRRRGREAVPGSFADKVFGNSGAEAVECAIKTVRRYQFVGGTPTPPHHHLRRRLPRAHARHVAATGNPAYMEGIAVAGWVRPGPRRSQGRRGGHRTGDGCDHVEPIRARAACYFVALQFRASSARFVTSTDRCWCSTRCVGRRPHRQAVRTNGPASRLMS